jgi:uncharacterized membrane protein
MSEGKSKSFWSETKWIIISFAVLLLISLPCCFTLGYYTNRILWELGLR